MNNSQIHQIKAKVRIENVISETVALTQRGKNLWGICPFHTDTSPSMSVSVEKQIFKCFACGKGGDVFSYVSNYKKVSFPDAVAFLGEKVGVHFQKKEAQRYSAQEKKVLDVLKDAMSFYEYHLHTNAGFKCLEYVKKRGLNTEIQQLFGVGYAPQAGLVKFLRAKKHSMEDIISVSLANSNNEDFFQNRLIFGIKDAWGNTVGFSGRSLSEQTQPKYLNSAENNFFHKSNVLYNFSNAKNNVGSEKTVYVTEGFMDTIAMHKSGFPNTVAIMGTALTKHHALTLQNLNVVLVLDNDPAGINASLQSILVLLKAKINAYVVSLQDQKDPDEVLAKHGKEGMVHLVKKKVSSIDFVFRVLEQRHPLKNPEGIKAFLQAFQEYLPFVEPLFQSFYVSKLADMTKIDKEILKTKLLAKKLTTPKPLAKPVSKNVNKTTKRNYSHLIINSIIRKNSLVDFFVKDKLVVNFLDPVLVLIFRYYQEIRQGKKVKLSRKLADEVRYKLFEIQKADEHYETEKEFKEIVARANVEYINFQIEANNVKLENTIEQNVQMELLESTKKLEIQKRKLEGKTIEEKQEKPSPF